jgi:spore coat polysaccharide biosynthesis protein SpsF
MSAGNGSSGSTRLREMSRHAIVILQARMGSSRLPGKVLAPVAGRSILSHCIRRLQAAAIGDVIVATSTRPEDMAVVIEAQRHGVQVVRGPAQDVLGRFMLALEGWDGPFVFRATADNPVVDIDAPGRVLKVLEGGADYCVEEGLPVGAAVEGMRTSALRESATLAQSPYDREHVTPYLRHQPGRFAVRPVAAPPECYRPHLRLTVDTRDDLAYVRSLLEQAGADARLVPLREVIALADRYASWSGVA